MRINALRKPQKVSAFRFNSQSDFDQLHKFCGELVSIDLNATVRLYVPSEELFVNILPGDWIIKNSYGEFLVVSPEVFAINYEILGGVDV